MTDCCLFVEPHKESHDWLMSQAPPPKKKREREREKHWDVELNCKQTNGSRFKYKIHVMDSEILWEILNFPNFEYYPNYQNSLCTTVAK